MVNKLDNNHDNLFDIYICKSIDSHLHIYNKLGLTPNMVTTLSLITGIISAYMIHIKKYKLAGILFFIAYYFDCVDGKLARTYNMTSKFGDYYDHFSDIIKFILIMYVLYKDNIIKFKNIGIIILLLVILCLYHLGCQQGIYTDDTKPTESPTLDILKPSKESALINIHNTKYFGCGTFYIILSLIIFFWNYF
jgi:phosphatidylglycerophosphate synthase